MSKDILFVCVENAGRSQMAEAFFRKFTEGKFNVNSAGTVPSGNLNPVVVEVMLVIVAVTIAIVTAKKFDNLG